MPAITLDKIIESNRLKKEAIENCKRELQGKISQEEFNSAKDSLIADLLDWKDSKIAMEKMKISNIVAFKNENISIDDMKENMKNVSMEDVIKVANKVKLKKIFVLGGVTNE